MSDNDVTIDGHAMYLRMAEQAKAQADKATDPNLRAQFLSAATHWLRTADDMEKFVAGKVVPKQQFNPFAATGGAERRKDHELRQLIDEYQRMAREAEDSAGKAESPRIQAELRAIARSWNDLAADLTQRARSA